MKQYRLCIRFAGLDADCVEDCGESPIREILRAAMHGTLSGGWEQTIATEDGGAVIDVTYTVTVEAWECGRSEDATGTAAGAALIEYLYKYPFPSIELAGDAVSAWFPEEFLLDE